MTDKLPDELGLVRCAIFPQAFEKGAALSIGSPFDYRQLLYFTGSKKRRDLSVGSRDILNSDQLINEYGCRTAGASNADKAARLGRSPEPLVEARHYLGFYYSDVGTVRSLENEVYDVDVERHVENGEVAHCHISMNEKDNPPLNVTKAEYRTLIIDNLWKKLLGPVRQLCGEDANHHDTLSAIHLPEKG